MQGGSIPSMVYYCVTVCVVASLAAVVVVLLAASSQAAVLVGLIGTLVVPTVTGLFAYARANATGEAVTKAHASLTEQINAVTDGK